ncbi:unnamed protein product [Mytilus edulis]|uniref:Uncharacterized protein n=1 Tax=Mytilus edulis TaxID=6550 RepID=A0A8S3T8H6_MYTED|nr:unnamed protein product [Mytilus edulis]
MKLQKETNNLKGACWGVMWEVNTSKTPRPWRYEPVTNMNRVSRQDKLLFSTANKVKEVDLDTGVVKELANESEIAYSLAYDVKERYVYVPILNENVIVRFPYPNDQTIEENVIFTNSPYYVAFDSGNRHLYWTERASFGKIMRCDSDGSEITTIANASMPLAVAVDTSNRFVMLITL